MNILWKMHLPVVFIGTESLWSKYFSMTIIEAENYHMDLPYTNDRNWSKGPVFKRGRFISSIVSYEIFIHYISTKVLTFDIELELDKSALGVRKIYGFVRPKSFVIFVFHQSKVRPVLIYIICIFS